MTAYEKRLGRFGLNSKKRIVQKLGTFQQLPLDIRVTLYPMIGDFCECKYPDANYKGKPIEEIKVVNKTPIPKRKRTKCKDNSE